MLLFARNCASKCTKEIAFKLIIKDCNLFTSTGHTSQAVKLLFIWNAHHECSFVIKHFMPSAGGIFTQELTRDYH